MFYRAESELFELDLEEDLNAWQLEVPQIHEACDDLRRLSRHRVLEQHQVPVSHLWEEQQAARVPVRLQPDDPEGGGGKANGDKEPVTVQRPERSKNLVQARILGQADGAETEHDQGRVQQEQNRNVLGG